MPHGSQFGWFFLAKLVSQSRDRRPRLSARKSLNNILLGNIPSFGGGLGRLLLAVFWRTDEGVCPYFVVLLRHEVDCDWKQREAFLDAKRASLHIKETPSSKRRGRFFVFSPAVSANEAQPRYNEQNKKTTRRNTLYKI